MRPCFSSTFGDNERINLIEGKKVVSEDREITETFKSYFETIVKNLDINSKFMYEEPVSNESVNDIIRKFQNHPIIIKKRKTIRGIVVFQRLKYRVLIGKLIYLMHLRPFSKTIFQ